MSKWTIFSNHGHVLLFLASDPEARLRDVAENVGITERAVQKIVRDLQDGGIVSVTKQGRRNRYRIHTRKSMRHELEAHCTVGQLVKLVHSTTAPVTARAALLSSVARETSKPKTSDDSEVSGIHDVLSASPEEEVAVLPETGRAEDEPGIDAPAADSPAPPAQDLPRIEKQPSSQRDKPEDRGQQGSLF